MKVKANVSVETATMVVYVPENTRLNFEVAPQSPPETKYNKRMVQFNKDAVKKIVGGTYGRQDN